MEFAGFGDWVEIFRGGKQVASDGSVHDGDALIEKAYSTFDPAAHEVPIVVGHPVHNSPSFGWAEGLKQVIKGGKKVLYAKFKQVVPEFEDLVKRGIYKKRSASFYPDGRLRHIGFLGGMPPAVKGLADLKFGDESAVVFEFGETFNDGGSSMDKFKEFMEFLKFWKTEGRRLLDDPGDNGTQFIEADVKAREDAARKKAEEETRKKVAAEFAETTRNEAKQRRTAAISSFCEQGVREGKILPAWLRSGDSSPTGTSRTYQLTTREVSRKPEHRSA